MSLIQDALKRKAEEATSQPPRHTPKSEPLPKEKQPAQPKTHTVLLIFLVVLLLLILLAGTAVYLIGRPLPAPEKTTAMPMVPPEIPTVSIPVAQAESATPAEPSAPATEPDPEPEPEPQPDPTPIGDWPELELSGIASSGTRGIAIINGKMLSAGRRLGDVIVREVQEAGVVVEYGGERRILYINE